LSPVSASRSGGRIAGWNNGRVSSQSRKQPSNQPVSPLRATITKASYPVIAKLHAMPKLTLPVASLLLVLIGAFAPVGVAVIALLLLALLLGWLGFLSWPVVSTTSRLLRVFAVLVIVFFAISRIVADGA
jgi:hypothetical protein